MAIVKQLTVGLQRIINLGNYENVRYECTATAELEPGDTLETVYAHLASECRNQLAAEVSRLQKKGK